MNAARGGRQPPGRSGLPRTSDLGALAHLRAGRLKLPDADNLEYIPLPGDPPPAANPMS